MIIWECRLGEEIGVRSIGEGATGTSSIPLYFSGRVMLIGDSRGRFAGLDTGVPIPKGKIPLCSKFRSSGRRSIKARPDLIV
jgi:hypothetical protein